MRWTECEREVEREIERESSGSGVTKDALNGVFVTFSGHSSAWLLVRQ